MDKSKTTLFEIIGGILGLTFIEMLVFTILELSFDIVYVDGIGKLFIGGILGSLIAIGLVCDMYRVFDRAFDCDSKTAESMVRKGSLLRMTILFTIIVLLVCCFRKDISIWMLFLATLNLKFAAYLAPVIDKFVCKKCHKESVIKEIDSDL